MYSIIKIVYKDENGNYLDQEYAKTKLTPEEVNAAIKKYDGKYLDITFIGKAGESICNGLTDREKEIIETNLNAYINNFDYIKIEKHGKEFFIYVTENAGCNDYVQCCSNINYVDGWLYGAVQCNNGIMKSIR